MRKSKAVLNLEARLEAAQRELATLRFSEPVRGPDDAAKAVRKLCEPLQETFVAVLLDARGKVIDSVVIALGSAASVEVHPRDVFRHAITRNAHSIVVGHNHPSGDTSPSEADIQLTRRLVDAGKLLGIPVLDHVIVAVRGSTSLASMGLV